MLTRQEVLLLVGVVHFVAVRAAITKQLAPCVCIIKVFDVCGAIHQTPMYGLLESILGAKGADLRQSVANVPLSRVPANFGLLVR